MTDNALFTIAASVTTANMTLCFCSW